MKRIFIILFLLTNISKGQITCGISTTNYITKWSVDCAEITNTRLCDNGSNIIYNPSVLPPFETSETQFGGYKILCGKLTHSAYQPTFMEYFFDDGTANPLKQRLSVGALSTGEMNLSVNMDYTTKSHRYYDSTKTAVWTWLGNNSRGIQYVPANNNNHIDIFSNYGAEIFHVLPWNQPSTGNAISNFSETQCAKYTLVDQANTYSTSVSSDGSFNQLNGILSYNQGSDKIIFPPSPSKLIGDNHGLPGGTSLVGGDSYGENLFLKSTSHSTKGKIEFGTASAYDESTDRLGLGTQSPIDKLHLVFSDNNQLGGITIHNTNTGNEALSGFTLKNNSNTYNAFCYTTSSGYNVGISNIKPNQFLFDVIGDGGIMFAADHSSGDILFTTTTSFIDRLRIYNSGSIAVGGSASTYKFSIKDGDIGIETIGNGFRIASGTNCKLGTGTLSSGVATISNSSVTSISYIFLQNTNTSTTNVGILTVVSSNGSFTVTSTNNLDSSTFNYFILESY